MKTADAIELAKSLTAGNAPRKSGRKMHPNSLKNLVPRMFKPGQSGNPGGKPKVDVAGQIARAVFENNTEAVYAALSKALCKGNAYVFKELSERAYGKLKESTDITTFTGTTDADLAQRIAELERELGVQPGEPVPGESPKLETSLGDKKRLQ